MDKKLLQQLGNIHQIAGKLACIPAYKTIENTLELGVLDGLTEIRQFIKNV